MTWEDIENIHRLHCQPKVAAFNTIGIPKDLEETKRICRGPIEADKTKISWIILDKGNHDFLGEIGVTFSPQRFRKAEIHYSLHTDHWGKGYGQEAVSRLLSYLFEEIKLHRVEAGVAVGNLRSIHLLEKMGMRREGRGIKILPLDGQWCDNYTYAILEEDYFNQVDH